MSTVIRFGTFNVGCGWADLETMALYASAQTAELNKAIIGCQNAAEQKARKQLFQDNIETSVANRLADQLDVISLQEITNEQRAFMKRLRERGFDVYLAPSRHVDYIYDCAIAVKSGLFKDVQDISILSNSHPDNKRVYGQAIGAIVAKVNVGAQLVFSSLHSWGFQLYPKDHQEKIFDTGDHERMSYTLTYAHETFKLMNTVQADGVFIGGDMNNNPDNYSAGFEVFEKGGYQVLDPKVATNVNYQDAAYHYAARTLDYIFVSTKPLLQRIWSSLNSIVYPTLSVTTSEAKVLEGFEFTIATNCSDHLPVGTEITISMQPSKLSMLWKLITFWIPRS